MGLQKSLDSVTIKKIFFLFQYSAVLWLSIIAQLPILDVTTKVHKIIYRCKSKTFWWHDYGILQLSTACLKASRDVLSTNGSGRLFHILIFSRKNECLYVEVVAYGTRNQAIWPLTTDDVVCSSSGGIATRPFTI
jgi:hypothetical protein